LFDIRFLEFQLLTPFLGGGLRSSALLEEPHFGEIELMIDCRSLYTSIVVVLLTLTLISCAPAPPAPDTNNSVTPTETVYSLIVLPATIKRDRIDKTDHSAADRLEAGRQVLDLLLAEYSEGLNNVTMIGESELEGMLGDFSGGLQSQARKIGAQLGSDAVLISTINRYVPRNAAESTPASVAFEYQLIAVKSGQNLCASAFDETQQPLLYNIFSLRRAISRKFKWISAEELLREGVIDRLDNCSSLDRVRKRTP